MSNSTPPKKSLMTHLVAGGAAGFVEACVCHPLDTIKVRMQLRSGRGVSQTGQGKTQGTLGTIQQPVVRPKKMGPLATAIRVVQKEGALALYKGLGAVISGIVPKMAIRFSSFELYKEWLADKSTGKTSMSGVFVAGLGAGVTESVAVVNPMEVIKIRLQAQRHSLADPLDIPKYRNAAHAAYVIIQEEGAGALYKGVTLTALRQATNQAVNFTLYQEMKRWLVSWQGVDDLPSWQHLLAGGLSGAMGPVSNAPIDTIKTRIQKQVKVPGESGFQTIVKCTRGILEKDGFFAFYNGLTPRLLRVAPGQAITFMVYEWVHKNLLSPKPPKPEVEEGSTNME